MDFMLGGAAACAACLFTNPFDVIKTRQQLQGELSKAKPGGPNPYKSVFTSIRTIVKSEGIRGLQKGLPSAMLFQFIMNATRLGIYEHMEKMGWTKDRGEHHSPFRIVVMGGMCGMIGSGIGAPFYLVKTQIQAMSKGDSAVGTQHSHRGTMDAFRTIIREGGLKGLWRGASGIMCRTAVGSASQLATFIEIKDFCHKYEVFQNSVFLTSSCASVVSGCCMVLSMTPLDVISTRLFNQAVDEKGRGVLYKNIFDCLIKTFKAEGFTGLYKGTMPNFYRAGPHTILHLTFWDLFKEWLSPYLSNPSPPN
ncbi:solute carrier family 25 member 35-like [Phlebotomus papatasi]|uniref:solute carrier family 25 member 35-like n=1 Tax=Phlebotomus papatasi TaxID=29031 RepID=UPI002484491F|nr:solute carrier family 25 member 35-like [Phlebotomus papatasi]XP_055707185.1 solute carrier family 25 member 35-like [Phlebotomus papatasi]